MDGSGTSLRPLKSGVRERVTLLCDTMRQNATLFEQLSPAQEGAISALLSGGTVIDAAERADVYRATVHRWLKEDAGFAAALNRGRLELRSALVAKLFKLAASATGCVERALEEGDAATALKVLGGMGLLSDSVFVVDSDDPNELCRERALREVLDEFAWERGAVWEDEE